MQVHPDIYGKIGELKAEAIRLIESKRVSERVGWKKAEEVVKEKKEIAEVVTL